VLSPKREKRRLGTPFFWVFVQKNQHYDQKFTHMRPRVIVESSNLFSLFVKHLKRKASIHSIEALKSNPPARKK
jgi:hypothetical protein